MNKYKINPGLACVLLVAAFLAGGATLLTVTALIFLFCEVNDRVEQTATRVVTFFIGITIVALGWGLIVQGIGLVTGLIAKLFTSINGFLDYEDAINYAKFLGPIESIVDIADDVVSLLLGIAKLGFVVALITNKPASPNFITRKIDEFVTKTLNFLNGVPVQAQQAPAQPQQPVQPQGPTA